MCDRKIFVHNIINIACVLYNNNYYELNKKKCAFVWQCFCVFGLVPLYYSWTSQNTKTRAQLQVNIVFSFKKYFVIVFSANKQYPNKLEVFSYFLWTSPYSPYTNSYSAVPWKLFRNVKKLFLALFIFFKDFAFVCPKGTQ